MGKIEHPGKEPRKYSPRDEDIHVHFALGKGEGRCASERCVLKSGNHAIRVMQKKQVGQKITREVIQTVNCCHECRLAAESLSIDILNQEWNDWKRQMDKFEGGSTGKKKTLGEVVKMTAKAQQASA